MIHVPTELEGLRSGAVGCILGPWNATNEAVAVLMAENDPWPSTTFVPAHSDIVEELTVGENLHLGALLAGRRPTDDMGWIEMFGLAHLLQRTPLQTSVGEQQRTAVARALLAGPALLIAHEPTTHQDARFGSVVVTALRRQAGLGTAVIIVTQHAPLADEADHVLDLSPRT